MATVKSPPGPQRSYPPPTQTVRIPFVPPNTFPECETCCSIWGDLTSEHVPLIVLHGGPGSPSRALQYFALINVDHGIPVIVYDQVGCGQSTHLRDKKGDTAFWTFELFDAELWNVIRHLKLTRFDVFGHSWGGFLALNLALQQPPGLRKLLISGTPATVRTRIKVSAEQWAQLPREVLELRDKCIKEGRRNSPEYESVMREFYQRHLCRTNPPPQELLDTLADSKSDDTVYSTVMDDPFNPPGWIKDLSYEDRLPQITRKTVPGGVLIMNGKFDTAQDIVMSPFFLKIQAKVKWVRFAESSHFTILEETENMVRTVADFLLMGS